MVEERLLIFRFKRGSPQALRRIYDKYKGQMLKLATVLLGDGNAAEDIVHDVFVSFAGSAERIKLTGSLRSYLTTSVVNRVRNHMRNNGRHGGSAWKLHRCLRRADQGLRSGRFSTNSSRCWPRRCSSCLTSNAKWSAFAWRWT